MIEKKASDRGSTLSDAAHSAMIIAVQSVQKEKGWKDKDHKASAKEDKPLDKAH